MNNEKSFLGKLNFLEKGKNKPGEKNEVPVSRSVELETKDLFPNYEHMSASHESKPQDNKLSGDKFLPIEEIYKKCNLAANGTDTIFIIDCYKSAIPGFLPTDAKRESVLNIIASSNMQIDKLMKDGRDRLNALKKYDESFSKVTDKIIFDYESEIDKLTERINACKSGISGRKKIQEEQTATIECEVQKLHNVFEFVNQSEQQ